MTAETKKTCSFLVKIFGIVVTLLLAIIGAVFAYGQLNSNVQTNKECISKNTIDIKQNYKEQNEAITNIRIQQKGMDTKLEFIVDGIKQIQKDVKK